MKRVICALVCVVAACGSSSGESNNGDQNSNSTAQCGALPTGGDFCAGSSDCPPVDCQCSNGVVSTRSCFNGVCDGASVCGDICAGSGGTDRCADTGANNTTSNNTTPNNTTSNNTTAPMCEHDLSQFASYRFSYDVTCLEQNCCQQAATCATYPSCKAYDDCIYDCFGGGGADQECIRTCKEQNTTTEFLDDVYAPFATCALDC